MKPVLATSGNLLAMLWCVCLFLRFAACQYGDGVMRFCAGVCVVGLSRSYVSSEGIGALSRLVRDVCMTVHKGVGEVGCGACCRRANSGVRASCRT